MASVDQSVLLFLAAHRAEWLTSLALIVTYCGSTLVIGGLTFLSAASFYIHKRFEDILALLVSVLGSSATVFAIKHLFYRARPVVEAIYTEAGSSFPSGHSAAAFALYGFLLYAAWKHAEHPLKNPFIIFMSALIIAVGLSRLYLGVHYLSDVAAGYIISLVWISLSLSISKSKIWHLPGSGRLL